MFGFFGKKNKKQKKSKISAKINTIPEEFYGAQDPVIHYKNNVKKVDVKKIETSTKKIKAKERKETNFNLFQNKKFVYIVGGIFLIIFITFISWYYIKDAQKNILPNIPNTNIVVENGKAGDNLSNVEQEEDVVVAEVEIEESISTEDVVEEEEGEEEVFKEEVENQPILEFPRIVLLDSVDIDNDSLTDLEEEVFQTDSGTWDTDGDGYYDGQEIINLYNPKGIAPKKLIDAGLIQEYVNPIWQYRIYHPLSWQIGEVDVQAKQVLFSANNGDFIEIFVAKKENQESFFQWFGNNAIEQKFSDIEKKENRFDESFYQRKDGLVAYFQNNNNIYVIIYHHNDSSESIFYRQVMNMMIQSFRPNKTLIEIPEQDILPTPPVDFENPNTSSAQITTSSI